MILDKSKNCASCGLCVAICPKQCLKIELNGDGFYRPTLIESMQCVNCGICDAHCPANFDVDKKTPLLTVSASVKDDKTLLTTSSGGICYEIARDAINQGKKVCGCIYDYEKHRAVHTEINNIEELEKTKGSKYFQSYTPTAFSKIFDGNDWVVFGTPCQISAIDSYAKKKGIRDKLLLVDFFCHGTPSMLLWDKYLLENDKEKIAKIDFRSKQFGWHAFSLRFTYEDGTTKSDFKDNMFYEFFFNNLVLNDSCYECKYKAMQSNSDIRVGDYWGERFKEDKKGVSCIVAFTVKGEQKIKEILENCNWQQAEIEDVLKAQMKTSPPLRKERKKILKKLKGKKRLKTINNTTLFMYRAKSKLSYMIKRK